MNMEFEITVIGERGQLVIPQLIRDEAGINKGDKFMVIINEGIIVLKKIEPPTVKDFEKMLNFSHQHAKKNNITPADLEEAIKKVRKK